MEFLIPVLVSVFIYLMSSANSLVSNAQSEFFVRIFQIIPFFRALTGETPSIIVRKLAHTFEYAVLAGSTTWAFRKRLGEKSKYLAFVFSVAYACTDEIHQIFVSGRSGCVQDVLVDTVGALVGISIVKLFS